ncbi:MAG: sulfurtransferase [Lautropia sp.]|nr:sulfurtransferase [Lautropia sp.]
MTWTTLISAEELAAAIDRCVVVDCRHQLTDPKGGLQAYLAGHIPSAFFLSMDDDLSGPSNPALGRHPLPERATLLAKLASIGLSDDTQLVVYDDQGGAMAGRLWMLARWLGHDKVAILDGGLAAWQDAGYPLSTELDSAKHGTLTDRPALVRMMSTDQLLAELEHDKYLVVDARTAERYRGDDEKLDPVPGHIPGAINRPMGQNLRPDGRFKPAQALREEWDALLAGRSPDHIVHQCGSGITANHNMLAMEIAGLTGSVLYPPAWSGWSSDPERPVARG